MKTTFLQRLKADMPLAMRDLYWLSMGFGTYGSRWWFGIAVAAWAVRVWYNFHPVVDNSDEVE